VELCFIGCARVSWVIVAYLIQEFLFSIGTSSVKAGEKPARRKSKVSWATLIVPGSAGPKPRPKGVGDGQLVYIPAPPRDRYHRWGDGEG